MKTICTYCVMDDTAKGIVFNEYGRCNYCSKITMNSKRHRNFSDLTSLIQKIKNISRGSYDCIVGVSGGIDSSYALYLAVKNGLRPLAVHLDNGWNSELAVHNINNLVSTLNVDLYTHVIDWPENRDLQRSFFKANVIDIEMLMDNAMLALNYQIVNKHGVRWIISGSNSATEGMPMPENWNWLKFDAKNIRSIHHKFGTMPIKSHPLISVTGFLFNHYIRKIKWLYFLDYFDYKKNEATRVLQNEVGYRPYPYKHYESVFTRFYQAFILPKKFGVDKRKLHLSNLIVNGEMSRDEAIKLLAEPTYPNEEQMRTDYQFVLKKLEFTEEEFAKYIGLPEIAHDVYGSESWIWNFLIRYKHLLSNSKYSTKVLKQS